MDDEPLRRSRALSLIGTAVAIALAVGLVLVHDPNSPIADLPLVVLGLFVVVLSTGFAIVLAIRVVVLSLGIRRVHARWRTSEPSE